MEIIEEISPDEDAEIKTCPPAIIYFADEGETVWDVAKRYFIAPDKIMTANNLDGENLKKGQKLCIFK